VRRLEVADFKPLSLHAERRMRWLHLKHPRARKRMLYLVQLRWLGAPQLTFNWMPNACIMNALSTAMAKVWRKSETEDPDGQPA